MHVSILECRRLPDSLRDPLLLTLVVSICVAGVIASSKHFATSVRQRSGFWSSLLGVITFVLYLPNVLLDLNWITPESANSIVATQFEMSSAVGLNWLISVGFFLAMTALTLGFSGTEQPDLRSVKHFCARSWLLFVVGGMILSAVEFLLPILARV